MATPPSCSSMRISNQWDPCIQMCLHAIVMRPYGCDCQRVLIPSKYVMQPHTWITGWPNPLLVRAMSYQSCRCFTAIHRVKGCAASLAKVPHLQATEELTLQWHKLRHPWKSRTKGELWHAVYNLTLKTKGTIEGFPDKKMILTENTFRCCTTRKADTFC